MAPQEDLDIVQKVLADKGIDCNESHYGGLDMYQCECPSDKLSDLKEGLTLKIENQETNIRLSTLLEQKGDDKC